MGESEDKIINIICGPTGSGKSSVAFELAKFQPIEIINADSRQMIKHLNIGTAKPTKEEQNLVRIHLIDIIEPGVKYSAFKFIDDANRAIENILNNNKIPLIVGGTGFYLRALTDGVVEIGETEFEIREKLEKEMESLGPEKMHEKLTTVDPLEAHKIHPNNKVKVLRALEIFYTTGKSKSEIAATGVYRKSKYKFRYFCLVLKRVDLYNAINDRVDKMIEMGFLDEIKDLISKGYKSAIKTSNVIGYNEIINYFDGLLSLDEAISLIKQNSRRYAKRQVTWFKKQENITYFENRIDLLSLLVEQR